jgi:hypothetical protein
MPASLQQTREDSEKNHRLSQVHGLSLALQQEDTGKQPPVIITRPGWLTMKFVNVGEKFVDVRKRSFHQCGDGVCHCVSPAVGRVAFLQRGRSPRPTGITSDTWSAETWST